MSGSDPGQFGPRLYRLFDDLPAGTREFRVEIETDIPEPSESEFDQLMDALEPVSAPARRARALRWRGAVCARRGQFVAGRRR